VVSKPGGATLWDALTSCVAVIFLPSHGPHEDRNADLWCKLGWGLRYEEWRADGFPLEPLAEINRNLLLAVGQLPVYPENLAGG
jgi:UDP-N-acetylglucosamine:LPS N-acetylglucosamine transferase